MSNLFIVVIILILAAELMFLSASSQHRKKRILSGWHPTSGVIRTIEKKYDSLAHRNYCELTIDTESGSVCYAKVGALFNQYEEGEKVDLMELNGVHRFLGNDRMNRKARKELAIGVIPILVLVVLSIIVNALSGNLS